VALLGQLPVTVEVSKAINRVFDLDGKILSSASPQLLKIRKTMTKLNGQVNSEFQRLAEQYKKQGILKDNVESYRNGRRVLAVPTEYKRKVKGIIHDQSNTGQTVFIEPELVVGLNNSLFEIQQEERLEIRTILKELTKFISTFTEELKETEANIVQLDILQAKVHFGLTYDGTAGELLNEQRINVKGLFHPLLFLKNNKQNLKTVPFDIEISEETRMILISGPNAGGKSITVKTLGLLILMNQCGFLLPAQKRVQIGIFDRLFVDIGDQQSIENDLSTYSSHLKNMNQLLKFGNETSFVLIDEFGSGTDPKMGGAIAESILKKLLAKKVFGTINTHYGNLKKFAHKYGHIKNAAMLFDSKSLTPTYQLKIGEPGSSFAIEVAQSIGLPKSIIKESFELAGKKEIKVDQLLADLQRERKKIEKEKGNIVRQKKRLDALNKQYEQLFAEMELKRKKFQLEKKEAEVNSLERLEKEVNASLKELKKNTSVKKTETLKLTIKKKKEEVADKIEKIEEELFYSNKEIDGIPQAGDHVILIKTEQRGIVQWVNKKEASLTIGDLSVQVPLKELKRVEAPLVKQHVTGTNLQKQNNSKFNPKLDVRGYTLQQATESVEVFLDQALLSNARKLEIIHGKGTGVLRKMVIKKIRAMRDVRDYHHPPPEEGGDGLTFVYF